MELVEGPGGVDNNLFLLLHVKEAGSSPSSHTSSSYLLKHTLAKMIDANTSLGGLEGAVRVQCEGAVRVQ